ncbi:MarR family winged helix-turn-helix transcriptional regulator [Pararhodobacter marinus]|uniref:MarR family winged helix-turn-helix transcriptional regulator n=1 Tax=Pararhodobacter marinus TaxID=2184063 RepID=UPI0035129892
MAKAALPRLENRVTFLTHRINARLQQVSTPVIAPVGLDLYSSRILFALDQNGPMKVGQLVDLMALPQSTISHQLKRMEKNGLLQRVRSDLDNRAVEVSPTEAGRQAIRICTALSDAIAEKLSSAFSPEEMTTLIDGLNRVFDALGEMPTLAERTAELAGNR